jgi:outer membrane protein assembly factor BamB
MVAAVGVVLAVGLFASPAAAVTTGITLKPSAGPPTTKVSVTGTGFGASETVAVDFSGTQVATATTSAAGTFSATFTVPTSAQPGSYPVTATGQASHRSATKNFLVRTDWAKFHFDAANSGLNPYENVITPVNVSGLKTAWTAANPLVIGSVGSSPAVAGGVAYIGSPQGNLYAFNAVGAGCSGTPKTCQPLWTGTTGQIGISSPAVAGGVVYLAADDGKFYAFSTTPSTANCPGTPKACKPLWTAAIGGSNVSLDQSSPVVAGGVVYVSAGSTLYAFSTTASTANCSGTPPSKTCQPLWTAANVSGGSSPAVAGGVVYVAGLSNLSAFSTTASTANCSGTPPSKTCTPLWTGKTFPNGTSSPAVANGMVYLGSGDGNLYAFSTAGCSGTCQPLWTGATGFIGSGITSSPAVANGTVYIGGADGKLYAFNAATGAPLWTAANAGSTSSPAVANGVVYVGSNGQLYAFSAAGTTGCSGTPKTCTPLWATGTSSNGFTYSSPAVANGMVYEGQWSGPNSPFSAYKLP